jgi:hypothetical protein
MVRFCLASGPALNHQAPYSCRHAAGCRLNSNINMITACMLCLHVQQVLAAVPTMRVKPLPSMRSWMGHQCEERTFQSGEQRLSR